MNELTFGTALAWLIIVFTVGGLVGCPQYNVWQQGLAGEAELARADQNRKILVTQAQAEMEAAKLRADAIEIVGEATQKYPEYRQQEFIGAFGEALKSGAIEQIIYVPTEANIPVMEATRFQNTEVKQ